MRKILTEAVGLAVCLAVVMAAEQMRDSTSPLRIAAADWWQQARATAATAANEARTILSYGAAKDAVLAEANEILRRETV